MHLARVLPPLALRSSGFYALVVREHVLLISSTVTGASEGLHLAFITRVIHRRSFVATRKRASSRRWCAFFFRPSLQSPHHRAAKLFGARCTDAAALLGHLIRHERRICRVPLEEQRSLDLIPHDQPDRVQVSFGEGTVRVYARTAVRWRAMYPPLADRRWYSLPMPLTRADLAAIRAIVRQELEQVLDGAWRVRGVESEVRAEESESKDARHEAIQRQVRADLAQMRRQARERAARPIPDGPFVDAYDADRLLQATGLTLDTWRRRGRLTRNMVKGKLQFSRAEIDAILAEHA